MPFRTLQQAGYTVYKDRSNGWCGNGSTEVAGHSEIIPTSHPLFANNLKPHCQNYRQKITKVSTCFEQFPCQNIRQGGSEH
jgi:hypothetical protein